MLHYGKRGITVHGACLMYYKDDKMVRRYFDCVVAGDAKQDAVRTVAIVEDLLYRVAAYLKEHAPEKIKGGLQVP